MKKVALKDIANTGLILFLDHHVSTAGMKMSFDVMPYLKEIYLDEFDDIAIMSSTQTGKTEWALIRGWACMDFGVNVFHVFSNGEAKNSFVKSRVDELCDRVPYYTKMERDDRRNRYLRRIGNANWKFVISTSRANFDEFPADVVIVDEIDSCDQDNLQLCDSRQENSPYKIKWRLGNPTVEGSGISELFWNSTRKEWKFKCKHCGEHFFSDFLKIAVYEVKDADNNHSCYKLYDEEWNDGLERDIYIRCPECKKLQERPSEGRWFIQDATKQFGAGKRSGYHISKIMKLNSPIYEIWNKLKESDGNNYKMQLFYNKILGSPYTGIGSRVTKEMLMPLKYNYKTKDTCAKPAIAGMDVGDKFDIQICVPVKHAGKRKRLLVNSFRCDSLTEIKNLIEEFNIKTLYAGLKPERNLMKTFRLDMFGKCEVVLVEETDVRAGDLKLIGFREKEEQGIIVVDRTWMLDEAVKNIKRELLMLPENFTSMLDGFWLKSMESITRIFQNEKEEYKWSKSDYDHFRFADAFSMLAWMNNAEPIVMGDEFSKSYVEEKSDRNTEYRTESIGIIQRNYKVGSKRHGRFTFRKR